MQTTLDHDALFKQLLTTFFAEFLALFAPRIAEMIESERMVFLDKETFATLIDTDRREADLVVQAPFRTGTATILIHLEHQAQSDAHLDRRMFRYFARFYERYHMPIYPIALCSYVRPRRQAADRHRVAVGDHEVLSFRYQVVQLNRIDWREHMRTENPAAIALMARMQVAPGEHWRVKATCLRLMAGLPLTVERRRVISQFVDLYLPLAAEDERAVIEELRDLTPAQREALMEVVTSWELRGRAEGRAEGHVEGRAEGQRELVIRLLTRKFGVLPRTLQRRVKALAPEQIEALAEALLEFTDRTDLNAWLKQQADASAAPETE